MTFNLRPTGAPMHLTIADELNSCWSLPPIGDRWRAKDNTRTPNAKPD